MLFTPDRRDLTMRLGPRVSDGLHRPPLAFPHCGRSTEWSSQPVARRVALK